MVLEFVKPVNVMTLPEVLELTPAGMITVNPVGNPVIVAPVAAEKLYVNDGIAVLIHVAVLVPDGVAMDASGLIVIVPVIV
jgi:hypothetical protein